MTPRAVTETVLRHAPRTQILKVPRGNHYLFIEYPEVVVPFVEAFLSRHFGSIDA